LIYKEIFVLKVAILETLRKLFVINSNELIHKKNRVQRAMIKSNDIYYNLKYREFVESLGKDSGEQ
jgi:hypothetical protein